MFECVVTELKNHAEQEYPKECCGVIVHNMNGHRYVPCANVADTPTDEFIMSTEDFMESHKYGTPVGIAHSHPDSSCSPSEFDKIACNAGNLPWTIIGYPDLSLITIYPDKSPRPYMGRKFLFGVSDCYTLIQDYYKREFSIELKNYFREDEFWLHGKNYYMERFPEQGFVSIPRTSELKVGDLILIQVTSDIPNHGAIYIGDGKILHHLANRLSNRTLYQGYWERNTHTIIRHKNLL